MQTPPEANAATRAEQQLIGDYSCGIPGPLAIFVGGQHGNEPAGVEALREVFAELLARKPTLRGRCLALAGNPRGLAASDRYIDEDLSRVWTPERMRILDDSAAQQPARDALPPAAESPSAGDPSESVEQAAQRELHRLLRPLLDSSEEVRLLDLHSTSGGGPPFSIVSDREGPRRLVKALGVPAVLGLHQNVPGTLIDWFESLGHTSVVLEAGQNLAPMTKRIHVAAVWLALETWGLLEEGELDLGAHRAILAEAAAHLPSEVEVCLRWGIESLATFRMEPGFSNFERVHRGQLLAHGGPDGRLEIASPIDGVLLMPLYQAQGSDGFFLGLVPPGGWPD